MNDIPVEEASIGASFRQNGKMFSFSSSFEPAARRVNTMPSITKEQAIDIAVNDKARNYEAELVIRKFEDQFRLTWKISAVSIRATNIGKWYIDAHSGEQLKYESLVMPLTRGSGATR